MPAAAAASAAAAAGARASRSCARGTVGVLPGASVCAREPSATEWLPPASKLASRASRWHCNVQVQPRPPARGDR
eukprot:2015091-Prymnesium_polylepis.1